MSPSKKGLDTLFTKDSSKEIKICGINGDFCSNLSYEPYEIKLNVNNVKKFAPEGGRPTNYSGFPYYNLQMSGDGVMLAIGWPGQWACSFTRDKTGVKVSAGQELTRFFLNPGEKVRSTLTVLVFYDGSDVVAAQNIWRRWYLAHVLPKTNGQPQQPLLEIQVDGNNIGYVDTYLNAGIKPNLCWRDAGGETNTTWFPTSKGIFEVPHMAWLNTGTWEIDKKNVPNGFRVFSDAVRARGMPALTTATIDAQKQAYSECSKIAPMMLWGDYYPLTPFSLQKDQWIAWQFHRPEQGDGVVQVFKRRACTKTSMTFKLRGLDQNALYEITNFDKQGNVIISGNELMNQGLLVTLNNLPDSAIITYSKSK